MKNKTLIKIILVCTVITTVISVTYLIKKSVSSKILSTPETKLSHWVAIEPNFNHEFYKTDEAVRIGDNILLFQSPSGGWNKNIHMEANFNILEKFYILYDQSTRNYPTIDNSATTTEIDYLSKLYNITHKKKYKIAIENGLKYLLNMQLSNGGFPQYYPNIELKYQSNITYNDKSSVNVLSLFYKIINNNIQYQFLDYNIKEKIIISFDKGIKCLLKTQLSSGAWAAQYNPITLQPTTGRIYELASIDSRETANNAIFLMEINKPSKKIKKSIKKAINWLNDNKISNHEITHYINNEGTEDTKITICDICPPIWARMYDITTNTPVFSDRSGKKFTDMNKISYERRNHYEWYVYDGINALNKYQIWKLFN